MPSSTSAPRLRRDQASVAAATESPQQPRRDHPLHCDCFRAATAALERHPAWCVCLVSPKEKPGRSRVSRIAMRRYLDSLHFVGLQALLALHNLEADLLAFLQRLEAGALDRAEV